MRECVVRRVTGRVAGDGGGFSLACVAREAHLTYIEPFLRGAVFGPGASVRCTERAYPADADPAGPPDPDSASAADLAGPADLTAWVQAGDDDGTAGGGWPADGSGLVLPLRVHMVADLGPAGPGISPRERKRQRRRVRDYRYDFAVTGRDADFEFFYDRMHVPTMRARHGEHARTLGRAQAFREVFRAGFLLLVRSGGQPVAGVLCRADGRTCHARLVGWLDGDPAHLRREAIKTGNHFLLAWAGRAGFTAVDFQGGEPFLTKGTFQSKRHLGARAVVPGTGLGLARVRLTAGRDTPALRDMLARNPALALADDGGLTAVYFADAARPPRLDIGYACPGIADHRVLRLDEFTAGHGIVALRGHGR